MQNRDEMYDFIDAEIENLRKEFGKFPVIRAESEDTPERFEQGRQMALDGWRGDAGVLPRDEDGRYLLIQHENSKGEWGVPGGGHKSGETMAETARRECEEETGHVCSLTGVIAVRIKAIRHETDPEQTLPMLTVWFEGSTESGTLASSDDEVVAIGWFDELPENVFHILDEYVSAE
ncbi:NUDIX hydrolase [Halocatena halophila]|uniref:NUDIX hydrolase n=1 Tax=Halocatena halophila TaxID=2814576 RepID=UPI002ED4F9D5